MDTVNDTLKHAEERLRKTQVEVDRLMALVDTTFANEPDRLKAEQKIVKELMPQINKAKTENNTAWDIYWTLKEKEIDKIMEEINQTP